MNRYSIGVDLGGTNLRVAAYEHDKGIVETIEISTRREDGRDAVIADLHEATKRLHKALGSSIEFVGAGVATPGPMELPEGRLLDPPNLPGWEDFELRRELEDLLQTPVILENDANAAALAEHRLGRGAELGVDSLCMITLGTGVGSGFVLNDSIWHGMNGMAGEIGHISVRHDGMMCACGTRGCLELYASATGLVRMARERASLPTALGLRDFSKRMPNFTPLDLYELAMQGDQDATSLFQTLGQNLGIALCAAVNSLNLPLYVIGGGVAHAWELFAPRMFDELSKGSSIYRLTDPRQKTTRTSAKAKTRVMPARMGSNSGIIGACLLPFSSSSKGQEMQV